MVCPGHMPPFGRQNRGLRLDGWCRHWTVHLFSSILLQFVLNLAMCIAVLSVQALNLGAACSCFLEWDGYLVRGDVLAGPARPGQTFLTIPYPRLFLPPLPPPPQIVHRLRGPLGWGYGFPRFSVAP